MERILWNAMPAMTASFYDSLSGHGASVSGVQVTALGHTIVSRSAKG